MDGDCVFLNPLRRDGTSQRQRHVEGLKPSYVLVDEREEAELLLYARQYATLLRYYTPDNRAAGDWVEFISHDISTLVAVIGNSDHATRQKSYGEKLEAALGASIPGRPDAYAELFPPVVEIALVIDSWYRDSIAGLALRKALDRLIGAELNDALRNTLAYAERARTLALPVAAIDEARFDRVWVLDDIREDASLFPTGSVDSDEDMEDAVERMSIVFDRFYQALAFLAENANGYLDETLESYPEHQPHMALFLAFLKLLGHARNQLNTLTAKHLDFYYHQVLGLEARPEVADQVHLIFELAKTFVSHRLPKDTAFKAGKDGGGNDLVYASDTELAINKTILDEEHGLKSVFVDTASNLVRNIYAAPKANSADGLGAAIEDEEGKWDAFGGTAMPFAEIGFALGSPIFLLAEATRVIEVTFHLAAPADFLAGETESDVKAELEENVKVYASGAKAWLPVDVDEVEISLGGSPSVTYKLKLGSDADPVVAYDDSVLGGGFTTKHPVLKFILDNEGLSARAVDLGTAGPISDYSDEAGGYDHETFVRHEGQIYRAIMPIEAAGFRPPEHPALWGPVEQSYPYKYFQGMQLTGLTLTVDVTGFKTLILENDMGVLNPAKPFHPFGPTPRSGSSFLIGSYEVFQKGLTALDLAIQWADLPRVNFFTHYTGYTGVTGNEHFKAEIGLLSDGRWEPLAVEGEAKARLFVPKGKKETDKPKEARDLSLVLGATTFKSDPTLAPFDRFDTTLRRGFLRLQLTESFQHAKYLDLLAKFAGKTNAPNAPYTPLMAELSLHYTAEESIDYASKGKEDFADRTERIFQIGPFGAREIYPIADDASAADVPIGRTLVPEFSVTVKAEDGASRTETAEGTLYFGLDGLQPPQNLSLLLQVAEGSENPDVSPVPDVVWSYLSATGWVDFETSEIVTDATNGLLTSGIVKLAMPDAMTQEAGLLPGKLSWIKASVPENSAALPKMIAVWPQAAIASFRNQNNDPGHLATAFPAGTISKLKSREAAIKSVTQPYASFGGRMAEADQAFYIRVSERLRHKNRAVSLFDYERLVLERFPEVYKVKCITHTSPTCEFEPGHVKLVVVPNLRNKNAVDPLKPRLSLNKREEIRDYLKELASDFTSIEVANPVYEAVRARFNVRFHPGWDKGLYTAQLEGDIVRFLSPWLYDAAADLTLGGSIHRSAILNFVEQQHYVDFVTDFEMDHLIGELVYADVEEAEATSSSSALVSAERHDIGHDVVSCEDPPPQTGSGSAAPGQPPGPAPAPPLWVKRYLGNSRSRELHDLTNIQPGCQIGEIAIDRRFYFSRTDEALALDYDYCAYCFGRELSRR